eukprot:1161664-Pelagomonas_calceolata.AAC.13
MQLLQQAERLVLREGSTPGGAHANISLHGCAIKKAGGARAGISLHGCAIKEAGGARAGIFLHGYAVTKAGAGTWRMILPARAM